MLGMLPRIGVSSSVSMTVMMPRFYGSKKTMVIALGGNALLREGEALSGATQMKNVESAVKAIAAIASDKEHWNIIVTHGNGPQVGFLALQQSESFSLDVLNAETQGMIGAQLDEALSNAIPGRNVTTLITQVEVDQNDPAFKTPTKPIGPFYEVKPEGLGPVVQVGTKWRRVVASPKPKRIVELSTIQTLVKAGDVVICCGGGGIPVVRGDNGHLHGIPAVIDKDLTACLLGETLGANALIMLTDADGVYKDWGKPTQARVEVVDVHQLDHAWVETLPAGSMRPKVLAAAQFAQATGGWAAIGSLSKLDDILRGTSGTRFESPKARVFDAESIMSRVLPIDMQTWTRDQVERWLKDHVRVNNEIITRILAAGYDTGDKLVNLTYPVLEKMHIDWMSSSSILDGITSQRLNSQRLYIDAEPYKWPFNGRLTPRNTALLIIDMQRDFLDKGGYIDSMGYSLSATRRCIEPIKSLLSKARELGFHVIHTREGHRPNLSDCPQNKHWRTLNNSALGIGDKGPMGRILVRGEYGWDIIDELKPLPEEVVVDKPGKGSFCHTDLEGILRASNIQNLIVTGVTTDVCVHTTLREANDRGFECLLVTDATAALDPEVHWAAVKSVQLSGGIFGATSDTRAVLATLDRLKTK